MGTPTRIAQDSTSIQVGWVAPSADGYSSIIGYRVYWNGGSGAPLIISSPEVDTNNANTLSHTFASLTPGERYIFAVSAYNEVFEGPRSDTIEIIAGTVPSKPDPIERASAGLTEIGISWTAPSNGNNNIIGYLIESDGGSGGQFSQIGTSGAATTTFLHTGLQNGIVYAYRVIAQNDIGNSVPSDPDSLRAAIAPDAPSAPVKTFANGSRIEIAWSAPASNGGSDITKYEVFMDDT